MEAPNLESIFECISDGVNKVLVLVLVLTWNLFLERIRRRFFLCGTRADQALLLQKSLHTMSIANVSICADYRAD